MVLATPFPITHHVVFDNIPVAALLLELDGQIVAVNAAASRVLGRPARELVGRPLGAVMIPDAELQRMLESSRHGGEVVHELHYEDPAGLRTVECVMSVIQADDRAVFQLFAIDVTVRKQAEAAARARADREAQNAAAQRLETFGIVAGGVAHEFNNLLVGVLAESSAAREDPQLGDAARDALGRIETAALRMAHLTRQMLAYSGRGRLVAQRLGPDELLVQYRAVLAQVVRPDVKLTVAPNARGSVIEADPRLLEQVVSNLVGNASEAGSTRIGVTSRHAIVEGQPQWQLDVTDDGIGMTPDLIARVFEPFFSTSPDRHGLGLSAVQGIVRRLGGDIEVDSTPGQGSRFSVRLPVIAGASQPRGRSNGASPSARLAGLRVLVVDDEPSVRSTVCRLLQRRGATVVSAADGAEAEAKLREGGFDLVITDVVMPRRGGYDVLATARSLHPTCRVVIMSGYAERGRGEGGDAEPDAFLEKPFTARVLDGAIDDVMHFEAT